MEKFKGQVAIVTGASAGIGAATAKALVEAGMKVVGLARRKGRIQQLALELEGKPGTLYAVRADMTKEQDILHAFKWTTENVGPVHVLINNAGIASNTDLIDGDVQKWRNILDINVLGLAIASKEAIGIMRANNIDGHIVNVNSIAGHKIPNFPNVSVYPSSKHAVTAMTETLRLELIRLGSKIKVTSVSPGLVATELFEANDIMSPEELAAFTKGLKILESVDVADAIMYVLATPSHVQVTELTIRPVGEKV